jgi:hypothetical protein
VVIDVEVLCFEDPKREIDVLDFVTAEVLRSGVGCHEEREQADC